ncbi:MAG: RNA 2',3'-cyclic phosphodiesterase [Candidatus Omnitrophota bacterium]
MRAFIAIELPQEIKTTLSRLQAKLKTAGADVKWVEPKNIHLTLKFLGEIDEQTIEKLNSCLEKIRKIKKPFTLNLSSPGAFPNPASPRVIWVGIKQGNTEIKEITLLLEKQSTEIGLTPENREFSAHITIGRTRSGKNRRELSKILSDLSQNSLEDNLFTVDKITFFKSTLTSRGPVYEAIKEFHLSAIR